MEQIVFGIGITALAGALATVAGSAEDTESNIGSQGGPELTGSARSADGFRAPYLQQGGCRRTPGVRTVVCSGRRTCMGVSRHAGKRGPRYRPGLTSCSLRPGCLCDNRIPWQDSKSLQVWPAGLRGHLKVHDHCRHGSCFCSNFLYCHHLLPDQRCPGTPVPAAAARFHLGNCSRSCRVCHRQPVLRARNASTRTRSSVRVSRSQHQATLSGMLKPASATPSTTGTSPQNSADPHQAFALALSYSLNSGVPFSSRRSAPAGGAIIVGILIILVFTIIDRYMEVWARKNYGPYTAPAKEA